MSPLLLRIKDVMDMTSMSRSTIYRMIGQDQFPKQKSIGDRQARWSTQEITDWCEQMISAN